MPHHQTRPDLESRTSIQPEDWDCCSQSPEEILKLDDLSAVSIEAKSISNQNKYLSLGLSDAVSRHCGKESRYFIGEEIKQCSAIGLQHCSLSINTKMVSFVGVVSIVAQSIRLCFASPQ
ncbi:unnamed protein product [Protopolystoma xenopodis]|uniref:Uncharacterized protein n=1 Tax=Protopolystoma xenopodis TaxID=117903 RepID=A0A3S4ZAS9_9PLAT|nr:unnamed protein product [Protopolystoma xenopodis]